MWPEGVGGTGCGEVAAGTSRQFHGVTVAAGIEKDRVRRCPPVLPLILTQNFPASGIQADRSPGALSQPAALAILTVPQGGRALPLPAFTSR